MTDPMKVLFALDPTDWHGHSSESLWARPIAGTPGTLLLELQNTPFFARNVSYLDVIRAVEANGVTEYAGTVRESGHSTYRLICETGADFDNWWAKLAELGCTFESATIGHRLLYALDIPPGSDIHAAYAVLEAGEHSGVWIFEEAHVGKSAATKTRP